MIVRPVLQVPRRCKPCQWARHTLEGRAQTLFTIIFLWCLILHLLYGNLLISTCWIGFLFYRWKNWTWGLMKAKKFIFHVNCKAFKSLFLKKFCSSIGIYLIDLSMYLPKLLNCLSWGIREVRTGINKIQTTFKWVFFSTDTNSFLVVTVVWSLFSFPIGQVPLDIVLESQHFNLSLWP